jgi:hypothetical protein
MSYAIRTTQLGGQLCLIKLHQQTAIEGENTKRDVKHSLCFGESFRRNKNGRL